MYYFFCRNIKLKTFLAICIFYYCLLTVSDFHKIVSLILNAGSYMRYKIGQKYSTIYRTCPAAKLICMTAKYEIWHITCYLAAEYTPYLILNLLGKLIKFESFMIIFGHSFGAIIL